MMNHDGSEIDPIEVGELRLRSESGPASATRPSLSDGVFTLTAAAKADMFLDPAGFGPAPTAERFVDSVEGDFQLRACVEVDFVADFDSGVLLGYIDDHNWFKICAELDPDGTPPGSSRSSPGTAHRTTPTAGRSSAAASTCGFRAPAALLRCTRAPTGACGA
jgi:hypothetical protein